jgi:hypothetical protein
MRTEASRENPPPWSHLKHLLCLVRLQPAAPDECLEHPPADLGLDRVDTRLGQLGGFVEAHRARGIRGEHPIEHAAMIVEMWVDGRSEAVQERNRAESRLGPRTGTDPAQLGLEGP